MPNSLSLFATCLVDALYPQIGEAAVTVLERLGYTVDFPVDQTCCGLPLYNNGYFDAARAVAKKTLSSMAGASPIVALSGSCTWMLRKIYPSLLDTDESRKFAGRVKEFSEVIAESGAKFQLASDRPATYHPSCHLLRGLGQVESPRTVLSSISPLRLVPLEKETECCGFGGTFSVRYDQISTSMLEDKLACVNRTGADTLVVTDAGCLMQLDGGARHKDCSFKVRHLAELLADAEPKVTK